MADERLCLLQTAVGRHERCPGEACPYWQDGGCPLEQMRADIETNPELAGFLLDLRAQIMGGGVWRPFRRVSGGER